MCFDHDARVLYCSATGASEPRNLAYMTRLHTHGFGSVTDMLQTLTDSGMGAVSLFVFQVSFYFRMGD